MNVERCLVSSKHRITRSVRWVFLTSVGDASEQCRSPVPCGDGHGAFKVSGVSREYSGNVSEDNTVEVGMYGIKIVLTLMANLSFQSEAQLPPFRYH